MIITSTIVKKSTYWSSHFKVNIFRVIIFKQLLVITRQVQDAVKRITYNFKQEPNSKKIRYKINNGSKCGDMMVKNANRTDIRLKSMESQT